MVEALFIGSSIPGKDVRSDTYGSVTSFTKYTCLYEETGMF